MMEGEVFMPHHQPTNDGLAWRVAATNTCGPMVDAQHKSDDKRSTSPKQLKQGEDVESTEHVLPANSNKNHAGVVHVNTSNLGMYEQGAATRRSATVTAGHKRNTASASTRSLMLSRLLPQGTTRSSSTTRAAMCVLPHIMQVPPMVIRLFKDLPLLS
jgi:hypothetical protein